ncbi:MAG: glycoside hydrolase family 3 N-terminal domain-containing protein [Actinomycetota bacterium]
MPSETEIRRWALSCLALGFSGQVPPPWLRGALADGLAGVILFGSNVADGDDLGTLTAELRSAAGRDLVIGLDEEGGDVTRLDATRGSEVPGAAALGALDDPATTEEIYAAIGSRLAASGVTLDLAPVADVNVDPENPVIGVRSFSADPQVAARHVAAAVRGLQRFGVAACVKHFPGHGATSTDSHLAVPVVARSRSQLDEIEFVPFRAAIAAGARAAMTAHLLVPALDAELIGTLSRRVTTDVLRGTLGFTGTIVTDALEMAAVTQRVGVVDGFVQALLAGADLIETGAGEYPELVEQIPAAVLAAVRSGRLSAERLAEASRRARALAAPTSDNASYDESVVAGAAAACVQIVGELPTLHRPLVVECHSPNGIATGTLPWSLASRLAARVPGTDVLTIDGPVELSAVLEAAQGRTLVAVIRDPRRHAWQGRIVAAAAAHPSAVVVDVGWPDEAPAGSPPRVLTRGIAPGLLDEAARALAASTVAAGGR